MVNPTKDSFLEREYWNFCVSQMHALYFGWKFIQLVYLYRYDDSLVAIKTLNSNVINMGYSTSCVVGNKIEHSDLLDREMYSDLLSFHRVYR